MIGKFMIYKMNKLGKYKPIQILWHDVNLCTKKNEKGTPMKNKHSQVLIFKILSPSWPM
jgi:hypothetical protein